MEAKWQRKSVEVRGSDGVSKAVLRKVLSHADAKGVEHVIVNGVEIIDRQKHTGALPGTVLRSGRDTQTVAIG